MFEGYAASHSLQAELPVDKEMLNRVLGVISQGRSGAEIQIHFAVKLGSGRLQKPSEWLGSAPTH